MFFYGTQYTYIYTKYTGKLKLYRAQPWKIVLPELFLPLTFTCNTNKTSVGFAWQKVWVESMM